MIKIHSSIKYVEFKSIKQVFNVVWLKEHLMYNIH